MNFRDYVTESNLSSKSLKKLELLLRNAESEADIKAIKQAIRAIKKIKGKKPVQTAGNQNLSLGDSLSVGGEGGTPPADGGTSTDGGGGAAVVGGPVV